MIEKEIVLNTLNKLSILAESPVDYQKIPRQIVDLVGEEFNALLVGLFIVDEPNNCATLIAATGKGGELLIKHDLKFSLSQHTQYSNYVSLSINNDVICVTGKEGIFYSQIASGLQFEKYPDDLFGFAPLLPLNRFVISVPLHTHQKVFAVLYLEHSEILEKENVVEFILPIARKIETLYEAA